MSEATNTKLMDTEAGGEQTQYEAVHEFTKPPLKEQGQYEDSSVNEATTQAGKDKAARGEKTAENVRYGEAISEHGFGGETIGNTGEAQQGGYGRTDEQTGTDDITQSRREQGYGGGSGVGA